MGMSHPKHLRGLVVAYSAEDLKVADGTVLTTWANRKRYASEAAQPMTLNASPTKVTDAGRPGVQFAPGTTQTGNVTFTTGMGTVPYTIGMVYRPLRTPHTLQENYTDSIARGGIITELPNDSRPNTYAGTFVVSSVAHSGTVRNQIIATFDGANSEIWLNGRRVAVGNVSTLGMNDLIVGAATASGLAPAPMILHELVIYRRKLRRGEIEKLENYFQNNWSVG